MNYWHLLLLDLPAVIGGSSMISLLSPWKMHARGVPALLFVIAMIVMMLPTLPVVALALMLPAAMIQRYLGIDLHGHEAADYSPATQKAKSAARVTRERVRRPKLAEITQFVTHAFPSPEDAAELAPAAADDLDSDHDDPDDPGTPGSATAATATDAGAPPTADQVSERLAALTGGGLQRPGLRDQHTPVRRFVPAL